MRNGLLLIVLVLVSGTIVVFGQNAAAPGYISPDPMVNISNELTKVSRSVAAVSKSMQNFVEKFEKVGGITFNEKQQKLILGMELLTRAEARVAVLQKSQIELVEKQNETRSKLAKVDVDLRPQGIERTVSLTGSTDTQERRENRQNLLQSERTSLSQLMQQIQFNLAETTEGLRDAQLLVSRLRKLYLPQIEREIYEQ